MPTTRKGSTGGGGLAAYRAKRNPEVTPEPIARGAGSAGHNRFVVQMHAASHLHFDLRLEMDGVLRSWAVPKGPSTDPKDKRFAALVEDHPLDYADFEGAIPSGNYGAGHVIVWDRGTWEPLKDPEAGMRAGKLLFNLHGYKLHGRFTLVRMKKANEWLFIKEQDEHATEGCNLAHDSIFSGLTVTELADPDSVVRSVEQRLHRTGVPAAPDELIGAHIAPMLATAHEPFSRDGWLFEMKFDGYRALLTRTDDTVTIFSRNGNDLTASFPEVCLAARRLPFEQFAIDGELTIADPAGIPSFSLLQQRMSLRTSDDLGRDSILRPATLWAFDLPLLLGHDLRGLELEQRKTCLQDVLPSTGPVRYVEHFAVDGREFYQAVRAMGLEGVVGKRPASTYRSGRSDDWLKVRADRSADFCVVGWRTTRADADDLGALLLAEYAGDTLRYVGSVGTGFSQAQRGDWMQRLAGAPGMAPLAELSRANWCEPAAVVEVRYREFTHDNHLRHPSFIRERPDKTPAECISSGDAPAPVTITRTPPPRVETTNPNKIFWPQTGTTKAALVDYYRRISPWMLPYLQDRPIVLTRFPDGVDGKSFYQRDAPVFVPDWIHTESLWSDGADHETRYFILDDVEALAYLANLGTVVIHLWSSRLAALDRPDWCILDLDPKDAPFADVIEIARYIHDLCDDISLPHYLKTSGASGLHILIPLGGALNHVESRTLGELLARAVVNANPDIATITRPLAGRAGKVYVDYLQNGHGRVLVAPFCVRAEPQPSVSMPLRWSELNRGTRNTKYTIDNAPQRMRRLDADPLIGVLTDRPDLFAALGALQKRL